jgi:hypothetical protein
VETRPGQSWLFVARNKPDIGDYELVGRPLDDETGCANAGEEDARKLPSQ